MRKFIFALSAFSLASAAYAVVPVYSNKGTPINIVGYSYGSYVAPSTGWVWSYFLGKRAAYLSVVSLKVNGVVTAESPIFPNQTTPVGTAAKLGFVHAGDTLELMLELLAPGNVAGVKLYSNPANNTDGNVHTYVVPYGGGDAGVPLGSYLYVGFEDIVGPHDPNYKNDWDYDDHRFAFTIAGVPEPASWAMLVAGFGLVGAGLRRKKIRTVSA